MTALLVQQNSVYVGAAYDPHMTIFTVPALILSKEYFKRMANEFYERGL